MPTPTVKVGLVLPVASRLMANKFLTGLLASGLFFAQISAGWAAPSARMSARSTTSYRSIGSSSYYSTTRVATPSVSRPVVSPPIAPRPTVAPSVGGGGIGGYRPYTASAPPIPPRPPVQQTQTVNRTVNNTTYINNHTVNTRTGSGGYSQGPGIGSTIVGTAAGAAIGTYIGNRLSENHDHDHGTSSGDGGYAQPPVVAPSPQPQAQHEQSSVVPTPAPKMAVQPPTPYTAPTAPEASHESSFSIWSILYPILIIASVIGMGALTAAVIIPALKRRAIMRAFFASCGGKFIGQSVTITGGYDTINSKDEDKMCGTTSYSGNCKVVGQATHGPYVDLWFERYGNDFVRGFKNDNSEKNIFSHETFQFTHIASMCDTDDEYNAMSVTLGVRDLNYVGLNWCRYGLGDTEDKVTNGMSTELYFDKGGVDTRRVREIMYSSNSGTREYLLFRHVFWNDAYGVAHTAIDVFSGLRVTASL